MAEEKQEIYRVVLNGERQYSIWPDWKQNAPGWNDEGFKGIGPFTLSRWFFTF